MAKFVIEAEIMVPRWEKHWRHYYLDEQTVEQLIAELTPEQSGLIENAEELRDLLTNKGEVSSVIKLNGTQAEVMQFLTELAKSAWKDSVPWDLDETEFVYTGDEKFYQYKRAYVITDEDFNCCIDRMQ